MEPGGTRSKDESTSSNPAKSVPPPPISNPTESTNAQPRPTVDIVTTRRCPNNWKRRRTPLAVKLSQMSYPCMIGVEIIARTGKSPHGSLLLAWDVTCRHRAALEHTLASLRELMQELDQTVLIPPGDPLKQDHPV
jgi:hypothetical protein